MEIVPAYERQKEILELFKEYTDLISSQGKKSRPVSRHSTMKRKFGIFRQNTALPPDASTWRWRRRSSRLRGPYGERRRLL